MSSMADRRSPYTNRPLRDHRDDSQHLTDDLIAYGDTVSVSDSLYLREMDVWTLSRGFSNGLGANNFGSMTNAPSNFGLLYQFNDAYAKMQGTWNQDLIQPQQFALQRLPDLTITGRKELFNNLMFADYDAEAVDFYRYEGVDGGRFSANPKVTLPWRLGDYVNGFGTIGAQAVGYVPQATTSRSSRSETRHRSPIPLAPAVAGSPWRSTIVSHWPRTAIVEPADALSRTQKWDATVLDRVYDFQWKSIEKLKNTIEPFANYAYVPRIYQGNQPLFDQTDRLNSRSLVTYGFTTRLFAKIKEEAPEETTTDATPTEAITGTGDPTVGPFHEDPLADSLAPRGGNIIREGEHSQELGSLTIQQAYDNRTRLTPSGGNVSESRGC